MGGKDPKKESKKDSGSSSRSKDKGKSSFSGRGHSSKGRETERERERTTRYGQAYDDQTDTVQSSSSRKGKEKSTASYGTSAPAASSLAPISEYKGTGGQFDNTELQYDEGNDLFGASLPQSGQTFPSSAPETEGIAFGSYYPPVENYRYATPNTGNYVGTVASTVPFDSTSNAFGYGTSPNLAALADTLSYTRLGDSGLGNSMASYAPQVSKPLSIGGAYGPGSSMNFEITPSINYGPNYGTGRGITKFAPQTPRRARADGRGRGRSINSKGTFWDIQDEGNRKAGNDLADKDLVKHPSKDFKIGKVIRVWWFEPQGDNHRDNASGTSIATDQTAGESLRGRGIPGKMRRFVIIETCNGHSIGIPITTYGFRGCAKPGCHPEDHSIIYTGNTIPSPLRANPNIPRGDEPEIPNPPVRMAPARNERLFNESRLNYSKKYTIEHNFKVAFIGKIADSSSGTFWQNLHNVSCQYQQQAGPGFDTVGGFQADDDSAGGPNGTGHIQYQ